jgi:restriction system protein
VVPIGLLIGAIVGFIGQSRAKSLTSSARANPKAISEMSWRDFERLVGEGFRQRGFKVTAFGGSGPDGGVDLAWHTPLSRLGGGGARRVLRG